METKKQKQKKNIDYRMSWKIDIRNEWFLVVDENFSFKIST